MILQVYTDGSWTTKSPDISGWGFIIFNDKDELISYNNGVVKCKSRQIDGELKAVIEALTYIKENINSYSIIDLYYDYAGIEAWISGKWKAKSEIAIEYINSIKDLGDIIEKVNFIKVKAHANESEAAAVT